MEHYLSLSKNINISITLNEMFKIHELMLGYKNDLVSDRHTSPWHSEELTLMSDILALGIQKN
jgi:hypothetical protein